MHRRFDTTFPLGFPTGPTWRAPRLSTPGSDPTALRLEPLGELLELPEHAAPGGHEALDLLDPVKGGGVVPFELLADLDEGQPGQLAEQVHGHVPGRGEGPGPRLRHEVLAPQAE